MTDTKYDVVGIGNAIVDILAYTDDAFLNKHDLVKGAMTLIDDKKAHELYEDMGTATECSGGSCANSLAGLSGLGSKTAFIGKVKEDQFGDIFSHDIRNVGVDFDTAPAKEGKETAHCLVLVTHDGESKIKGKNAERTMATYLGASTGITIDDIDPEVVRGGKVLYLEGYLWDFEPAVEACMKAINIAHDHGRKVAFTLSDPFCVDRHRDKFLKLVKNHVDILFANESEIKSLYEEQDLRKCLFKVGDDCEIAAITKGANGSMIIGANNSVYDCDAERVDDVYDVTGAGDLYAAGFLYGYVNDLGHEKSAKLGSLAAAEVIKYLGARPLTDLSNLADSVAA
jgi:sugar/nucleoside kinase (ribokinase family)